MNRLIRYGASLVVAVTALGGCAESGMSSESPFTPDRSREVTEHRQPTVADRLDVAVQVVRDEYPYETGGMSDRTIINAMQATCDLLDSGLDLEGLVVVLYDEAGGDMAIAEILAYTSGVGTSALCPEHRHIFEG